MTHEEFVDWLSAEVQVQRMTESQMKDLLQQKSLFDEERSMLEALKGRIVGYVAGQRKEAEGVQDLLREAGRDHPGKMIYFEPIGFTLF